MIDAVDQVVKIKWLISPMKKRDYGPWIVPRFFVFPKVKFIYSEKATKFEKITHLKIRRLLT